MDDNIVITMIGNQSALFPAKIALFFVPLFYFGGESKSSGNIFEPRTLFFLLLFDSSTAVLLLYQSVNP